jgi:hypothetical protein
MIVSYFGHHIFCIENDNNIVLTNPWFSKFGAYQNTWYPFPKNFHLLNTIKQKLNNNKNKYIYINSSDPDCYDKEFINSLGLNITIILSPLCEHLYDELRYKFQNIIILDNSFYDIFDYNNGLVIKLDNKIFYYLEDLYNDNYISDVNILTMNHYDIVGNQINNKYDNVIKCLNKINHQYYIPINAPVFFYDTLYDMNFRDEHPFAYNLKKYINNNVNDNILVMNSNDKIDLLNNKIDITEFELQSYLHDYKNEINPILVRRIFDIRQQYMLSKISVTVIFDKLYKVLVDNINKFKNYKGESIFIKIQGVSDKFICLNFDKCQVDICINNVINNSYIEFELYLLDQLLNNKITWKELFRSFQVDCYNVDNDVIQLFTLM